MKRPNSKLVRKLAERLSAHAERLLPARQREWGAAMRAEIDHIDGPLRALQWSFGCVIAGYLERFRIMNRSHAQVSGWLYGIESLICFGPLTALWYVAILNVGRFSNEPRIMVGLLFATLAPIALFLSLRYAALRKSPGPKVLLALMAGFVALAIFQVVSMFTQAPNFGTFWSNVEWRILVLQSVLPAVCCWHFSMLEGTGTFLDLTP